LSPFLFLEVKIQTKLEAYWTWVRIAIDTVAYLWVDTLILGNDEWILNSEVDTSTANLLGTSLDQCREAISQSHVATLQVRRIAYKVVTGIGGEICCTLKAKIDGLCSCVSEEIGIVDFHQLSF
jgi:hypothetical protein